MGGLAGVDGAWARREKEEDAAVGWRLETCPEYVCMFEVDLVLVITCRSWERDGEMV